MAGVLTNVVKGQLLGHADSRLQKRGETPADYKDRLNELLGWLKTGKAALSMLKHATTLTVKGDDRKVAETPEEQKHTDVEFFGTNAAKCFFPGLLPNTPDDMVRGAYIRAIELALGPPLPLRPAKPIVSYWIINGRKDTDPDGFEAFVAETEHEVHVLLLTPMPVNVPDPPAVGRTEDMYIVSTTTRIQDIDKKWPQTAGYGHPRPKIPMPGTTAGVECLQVMGY